MEQCYKGQLLGCSSTGSRWLTLHGGRALEGQRHLPDIAWTTTKDHGPKKPSNLRVLLTLDQPVPIVLELRGSVEHVSLLGVHLRLRLQTDTLLYIFPLDTKHGEQAATTIAALAV